MRTTQKNENTDFNKVWLMFQETDKRFQETDKQLKETRAILEARFRETDERIRATDRQIQETDQIVRNLTNKFKESEKRWGKFVEALVEGKLVDMLNEKGIPVNMTLQRIKRKHGDDDYEIDLIAKDGNEIVVVEVKTTLGIEDVQHFIDKLKIFKKVITCYENYTVYGAIAYINENSEAEIFAQSNGLFTIKATGDSALITNPIDFNPNEW